MPTQMESLARSETLDLNATEEAYSKVDDLRHLSRDFYTGEHVVKAAGELYLKQIPGEKDKTYKFRKELAVFDNWVQVVMLYRLSLQWRQKPKRALPPEIAPFEGNIDGAGMNANTFFRSVNEDGGVDGLRWVMVDKPPRPKDENGEPIPAANKAEEHAPYAVSVPGDDVLDWAFGEDGALDWAVIRQDVRLKPGPGQKACVARQRLVWTRKEWGLFESRESLEKRPAELKQAVIAGGAKSPWKLIDQGANAIGRVPLVAFYGCMVRPGYGLPAIKDVLGLQKGLYNKSSHRDKAELTACNVIPWATSAENPGTIEIGEDLMSWLPTVTDNGQVAPASFGMLESSGTGIEACRRTEDNYIARIMQIGALQAHGRLPSGQVQSAEGIKMEGRQFSGSLASVAEQMEAGEIEVWRLFWLHAVGADKPFSDKNGDGHSIVEYNKDFDEDRLSAELLDKLLKACTAGKLSTKTWLQALDASRKLPFEIDAEQEISNIEADADRSTMPGFDSGQADNEEPEEGGSEAAE